MDLQKLFETQRVLDEHIYEKHPELRGQNNLDWKILALQVELGECANEWRGFKKWSNDQEPRNHVHAGVCSYCGGTGEDDTEEEYFECDMCGGEGEEFANPLLEEYVDCLHFILSIGLELDMILSNSVVAYPRYHDPVKNITFCFSDLMLQASTLLNAEGDKEIEYMSLLSRFFRLGLDLGFTWGEIEQAYYAKNRKNHSRQESGY